VSGTPYDDAFKHLAEQDPESLLILVGAFPPNQPVRIKVLSRELRTSKRIVDQAYLVTTGNESRIAHLEAQTRYDAAMPERMLEYALMLWLAHKRRYAVDSFVLLLTREGLPREAPEQVSVKAGSLSVTVRYHLVRLWEIEAQSLLALNRDQLLPFVPLMKGGLKELEASARRVARLADRQQRDILALNLLTLGSLRYNRDTIEDVFRRDNMILELIKDTPYYRYMVDEERKKALREGRKTGKQEGSLQVARKLLLRLAEKRFPKADIKTEVARIRSLSALEQLCVDIDDIKTERALRQRLGKITPAKRALKRKARKS